MSQDSTSHIEDTLLSLYTLRDFNHSQPHKLKQSQLQHLREQVLSYLSEGPNISKSQLWYFRGRALAGSNSDLELAENYLSKAIKLDPDFTEAYLYLADVHTLRQQWVQAERVLEASLILSKTPAALRLLSRVIRQTSKQSTIPQSLLDRSVSLAKEALDMDLNLGEGWLVYGLGLTTRFFHSLCPQLTDLDKALIAFNRAEKFDDQKTNPDVFFNRAQVLTYLECFAEAINDFNTVLELDPGFSAANSAIENIYSFSKLIWASLNRFELQKKKKLSKLVNNWRNEIIQGSELVSISDLDTSHVNVHVSLRIFCLVSDEERTPVSICCYDSEGSPIIVSLYEVKSNIFKPQQNLTILKPKIRKQSLNLEGNTIDYQLISIRDSLSQIILQGEPLTTQFLSNPKLIVNQR
ncbi:hypothetical protein P9112_006478 [Eukaryota sp. TZLM1-RC]